MAARQRQSQPKPELGLPVDLDKEKLKKAFDVSHFDINAVLRGIELTLVGGTWNSGAGVVLRLRTGLSTDTV